MSAWWTGIPPAQATVECGRHRHTLRWADGTLEALDHGDPEDEATLAALAGEPIACLELLRAWRRRHGDPRALTLASRGPTDALAPNDDPHRMPGARGPRLRSEAELVRLLALGGGLPDRLQASAAAVWTRRLATGHSSLAATRPQLQAALYGRVLATLRPWLAEPELAIELSMITAAESRSLTRTGSGAVAVSLPFAWVPEVWTRGLAVVFGRVCIAAHTDDGARWNLHTVGPDLSEVTRVIVEL